MGLESHSVGIQKCDAKLRGFIGLLDLPTALAPAAKTVGALSGRPVLTERASNVLKDVSVILA